MNCIFLSFLFQILLWLMPKTERKKSCKWKLKNPFQRAATNHCGEGSGWGKKWHHASQFQNDLFTVRTEKPECHFKFSEVCPERERTCDRKTRTFKAGEWQGDPPHPTPRLHSPEEDSCTGRSCSAGRRRDGSRAGIRCSESPDLLGKFRRSWVYSLCKYPVYIILMHGMPSIISVGTMIWQSS